MLPIAAPRRALFLGAALVLAVAVMAFQWFRSPAHFLQIPLCDFVEYWAAGRLEASGQNPYDPEAMDRLERQAGRDTEAILMWNPPWTLPFVVPLGLLDCRVARVLWLLLNFVVLGWCVDSLWHFYGGPREQRWASWLLTLFFLPAFVALVTGQISPLVLLGAVGFLRAQRSGQDLRAGAWTVLLAIKPHLAYLFWPALALWAWQGRRGRVVAGGLLAALTLTGVALACNPEVLGQYWQTFTHRPPSQYRSPTLGAVLRLVFGEDRFGLQFLAMLPGLAWFVVYGLRHRRDWDWGRQMPPLLLISVLTTSYGAWLFDLVLLLVPVIAVGAAWQESPRRNRILAAALFLAINAAALVQLTREVEYFTFIWMTPALLVAYLLTGLPSPGRKVAVASA
jgi:hypothetical protein